MSTDARGDDPWADAAAARISRARADAVINRARTVRDGIVAYGEAAARNRTKSGSGSGSGFAPALETERADLETALERFGGEDDDRRGDLSFLLEPATDGEPTPLSAFRQERALDGDVATLVDALSAYVDGGAWDPVLTSTLATLERPAAVADAAALFETIATAALTRRDAQRERVRAALEEAYDRIGDPVTGLEEQPVALFPIRLETRFVEPAEHALADESELWIRAYPDQIHVDSHESELTVEEERWGQNFWATVWLAAHPVADGVDRDPTGVYLGDRIPDSRLRHLIAEIDLDSFSNDAKARYEELKSRAWGQLVERFGPHRAAYLVHALAPTDEEGVDLAPMLLSPPYTPLDSVPGLRAVHERTTGASDEREDSSSSANSAAPNAVETRPANGSEPLVVRLDGGSPRPIEPSAARVEIERSLPVRLLNEGPEARVSLRPVDGLGSRATVEPPELVVGAGDEVVAGLTVEAGPGPDSGVLEIDLDNGAAVEIVRVDVVENATIVPDDVQDSLDTDRIEEVLSLPTLRFPAVSRRTEAWSKQAQAALLPDRWVALLEWEDDDGELRRRAIAGDPIPDPLPIGPRVELAEGDDENGASDNGGRASDEPAADDGTSWLSEIEAAFEAGMALRVPLSTLSGFDERRGFERVTVLGAKASMDATETSTALRELLGSHQYTEGMSFLPEGTATNVPQAEPTGALDRDPAAVGPPRVGELDMSDGDLLARALGFGADGVDETGDGRGIVTHPFAYVSGADATDQLDARHMNSALWPATIGYALQHVYLSNRWAGRASIWTDGPEPFDSPAVYADADLPLAWLEAYRRHFVRYVRARGPLPTIRVGRQPYGVLPVTATRDEEIAIRVVEPTVVSAIERRELTVPDAEALGISVPELAASDLSTRTLVDAGADARALYESGIDAIELLESGVDADTLRELGETVDELSERGVPVPELVRAGFEAAELRRVGATVRELADAGADPERLARAGVSVAQLAGIDLPADEVVRAGFAARDLLEAGFAVKEVIDGGAPPSALRDVRLDPATLEALETPAGSLRIAGVPADDLLKAGYTAVELLNGGFSEREIADTGITVGDVADVGRSAAELARDGNTVGQLRESGFGPDQLLESGFGNGALLEAGYTVGELLDAGADVEALVGDGADLGALRTAGTAIEDLLSAGADPVALREAGTSAAALVEAGLDGETLSEAGYTPAELEDAGVEPAPESVGSEADGESETSGVDGATGTGADPNPDESEPLEYVDVTEPIGRAERDLYAFGFDPAKSRTLSMRTKVPVGGGESLPTVDRSPRSPGIDLASLGDSDDPDVLADVAAVDVPGTFGIDTVLDDGAIDPIDGDEGSDTIVPGGIDVPEIDVPDGLVDGPTTIPRLPSFDDRVADRIETLVTALRPIWSEAAENLPFADEHENLSVLDALEREAVSRAVRVDGWMDAIRTMFVADPDGGRESQLRSLLAARDLTDLDPRLGNMLVEAAGEAGRLIEPHDFVDREIATFLEILLAEDVEDLRALSFVVDTAAVPFEAAAFEPFDERIANAWDSLTPVEQRQALFAVLEDVERPWELYEAVKPSADGGNSALLAADRKLRLAARLATDCGDTGVLRSLARLLFHHAFLHEYLGARLRLGAAFDDPPAVGPDLGLFGDQYRRAFDELHEPIPRELYEAISGGEDDTDGDGDGSDDGADDSGGDDGNDDREGDELDVALFFDEPVVEKRTRYSTRSVSDDDGSTDADGTDSSGPRFSRARSRKTGDGPTRYIDGFAGKDGTDAADAELDDLLEDVEFDASSDVFEMVPTYAEVLADAAADDPTTTAIEPRLSEFTDSLAYLATCDPEEIALLLGETLDLASHRLDAWWTSLATKRLFELRERQRFGAALETVADEDPETVRATAEPALLGGLSLEAESNSDPNPKPESTEAGISGEGTNGSGSTRDPSAPGLYVGAYGVVENLRPSDDEVPSFVHAPSEGQATTAALLRSGYLAGEDADGDNPLAIDLSAERVREARWLLEGVRRGQPLGELLGYRLERRLHEVTVRTNGQPNLMAYQPRLREAFPAVADELGHADGAVAPDEAGYRRDLARSDVVDGYRLVRNWDEQYPFGRDDLPATHSSEYARLKELIDELRVDLAAVGDLLLAESVHQLAQNNLERAGGSLDALATGAQLPDPTVTTVPRTETGVTHRQLALFATDDRAGESDDECQVRAIAEPALETWLASLLPAHYRVGFAATYRWEAPQVATPGGDESDGARDGEAESGDELEGATIERERRIASDLSVLELSNLDLLALARDAEGAGQSELESRLAYVLLRDRPTDPAVPDDATVEVATADPGDAAVDLASVIEVARSLRELLENSRPATGVDLSYPGESSSDGYDDADVEAVATRANAVQDRVESVAADLAAQLAVFGYEPAEREFDPDASLAAKVDDVAAALAALAVDGSLARASAALADLDGTPLRSALSALADELPAGVTDPDAVGARVVVSAEKEQEVRGSIGSVPSMPKLDDSNDDDSSEDGSSDDSTEDSTDEGSTLDPVLIDTDRIVDVPYWVMLPERDDGETDDLSGLVDTVSLDVPGTTLDLSDVASNEYRLDPAVLEGLEGIAPLEPSIDEDRERDDDESDDDDEDAQSATDAESDVESSSSRLPSAERDGDESDDDGPTGTVDVFVWGVSGTTPFRKATTASVEDGRFLAHVDFDDVEPGTRFTVAAVLGGSTVFGATGVVGGDVDADPAGIVERRRGSLGALCWLCAVADGLAVGAGRETPLSTLADALAAVAPDDWSAIETERDAVDLEASTLESSDLDAVSALLGLQAVDPAAVLADLEPILEAARAIGLPALIDVIGVADGHEKARIRAVDHPGVGDLKRRLERVSTDAGALDAGVPTRALAFDRRAALAVAETADPAVTATVLEALVTAPPWLLASLEGVVTEPHETLARLTRWVHGATALDHENSRAVVADLRALGGAATAVWPLFAAVSADGDGASAAGTALSELADVLERGALGAANGTPTRASSIDAVLGADVSTALATTTAVWTPLETALAGTAVDLAFRRVALEHLRDPMLAASFAGAFGAVPTVPIGASPRIEEATVGEARVAYETLSDRAAAASALDPRRTQTGAAPMTTQPIAQRMDAQRERLEGLLDGEFPILPPFSPQNGTALASTFGDESLTADGGPLAAETWLQRIAHVRERPARFRDALSYVEAISGRRHRELRVGQLPHRPGDSWVGTDGVVPEPGRLSMVAQFGPDLEADGIDGRVAGLLIDEWVEEVPEAVETTGVALRSQDPGNRAPQSILLAVPPEGEGWSLGALYGAVTETMAYATYRAVDLDDLEGARPLVPALFFANDRRTQPGTPSIDFDMLDWYDTSYVDSLLPRFVYDDRITILDRIGEAFFADVDFDDGADDADDGGESR